jgi:predicted amidohydrolase YtcJ
MSKDGSERKGFTRRSVLRAGALASAAAAAGIGGARPAAASQPAFGPGDMPLPGSGEAYEGDLVLHSGRIHTMNDRNDIVEVVAIQDGTIVYTGGSLDEGLRQFSGRPHPQMVDLHGRMACPGIIDVTNHVSLLGNRPGHHTPLEYASSLADVFAIYRARARGLPPSPSPPLSADNFITTMGDFVPQQLVQQRLPTLAELDSAVPNHAVYITVNFTGPSVTNSLGKAFFENAQPYPVTVGADGSIAEGEQTGRATFALRQTLTFDQRVRGFRDAFAYLASIGLTTNMETGAFQTTNSPADNVASEDNYTYNIPAMALYAAGEGIVRMRIDWLEQDTDPTLPMLTQRVLNSLQFNGNDMVRTGGIGEWISGDQFSPGQVFQNACVFLAKNRWRAECQSLTTTDFKGQIDAFAMANAQYPITDLRWVVAHCNHITEDYVNKLKALGGGCTASGWEYLEGTGSGVSPAGPPYRMLFDNGIPVGMESDAADVSVFIPWVQMYYATTGKNVLGQQINPGQQATRQEALFHYTNGNTWFVGPPPGLGPPDGDLLGVIEVGRHGDVVVLSDDYFAVPDEQLKKLHSVLTVVNGKVVHTGEVRYAAGQPIGSGPHGSESRRPAVRPAR